MLQNSYFWPESENTMNISQVDISIIHQSQDPDTSVISISKENELDSLLSSEIRNFKDENSSNFSNRSGLLSLDDYDHKAEKGRGITETLTQASENLSTFSHKTGLLELQDCQEPPKLKNSSFLSKSSFPQRPGFLNSILGERHPLEEISNTDDNYRRVPSLYQSKLNFNKKRNLRKKSKKLRNGYPSLQNKGFDFKVFEKEKQINTGLLQLSQSLLSMCKSVKSEFERVKNAKGAHLRNMKKSCLKSGFREAEIEMKAVKDRMREIYGIELDVY